MKIFTNLDLVDENLDEITGRLQVILNERETAPPPDTRPAKEIAKEALGDLENEFGTCTHCGSKAGDPHGKDCKLALTEQVPA